MGEEYIPVEETSRIEIHNTAKSSIMQASTDYKNSVAAFQEVENARAEFVGYNRGQIEVLLEKALPLITKHIPIFLAGGAGAGLLSNEGIGGLLAKIFGVGG